MQINCETEFELLQLLDILYYTDNSTNYKLFIRNLLSSLNDDQLASSRNRILNRISLMACHFMLPEFKLLRKINWTTEADLDDDVGKLKSKTSNEPIYEENINFTQTAVNLFATKQGVEIETGSNLTSKPNDIEKLSATDSTLFILFDTNKTQMTSGSQAKPRCKQFKLSRHARRVSTKQPYLGLKYNTRDDYETIKNETPRAANLATHSDEFEESDKESVDSVIEYGKMNQMVKAKRAVKRVDSDKGGGNV